METKFFLINKNNNLIGGHDYGSLEAAKAAIENCNIPKEDAEVVTFEINFLNDCYIHPEKYLKH